MLELCQVDFQAVAVLRGVAAVSASILINIGVRFHMAIQHGFINAFVIAFCALVGFRAYVITNVVVEMVPVFRNKGAFVAL